MEIIFVDEGESNRALIALNLYEYIVSKTKKSKFPKAKIATVGENKSLHLKAMKALKEFGLSISEYSRKDVEKIEEIQSSDKTKFIVLGHDTDKSKLSEITKKKNVEFWAIDNPINECKSDVKLRFFRRVRDQLWVKIESLVEEFK